MKKNLVPTMGLIAGMALIIWSILLSGNINNFVDIPSVIITVFGSFSALLISFPFKTLKNNRFNSFTFLASVASFDAVTGEALNGVLNTEATPNVRNTLYEETEFGPVKPSIVHRHAAAGWYYASFLVMEEKAKTGIVDSEVGIDLGLISAAAENITIAEKFSRQVLCLPIYPEMPKHAAEKLLKIIKKF